MEDPECADHLAIGDDVSGAAGEVGGVIALADVVTIAALILEMIMCMLIKILYKIPLQEEPLAAA